MRAEPELVPEANFSKTKGELPVASLSQACHALSCFCHHAVPPSSLFLQCPHRAGWPLGSAQCLGEAQGTCLLAPSFPHAGSCGLLQSSGCYAALFIQGEPGREQEHASSRAGGRPSACPDRRPAARGCEAGRGQGRPGGGLPCPCLLGPTSSSICRDTMEPGFLP